jgi:endonuclease YncB( thermonuclease family)
MTVRILPLPVLLVCLATAAPVLAQTPETTASVAEAERIVAPMRAIDTVTLRTGGQYLRLWGVRAAQPGNGALENAALALLDDLTQQGPLNCKPIATQPNITVARCATGRGDDLALALLNAGYATIDRAAVVDTTFESAYAAAQDTARTRQRGVFRAPQTTLPLWLPAGLILGLVVGFAAVAGILRQWLKTVVDLQKSEAERGRAQEERLQSRERHVLVATLEGELQHNRDKIDAFLALYGDMLRDLKSGSVPKYQQSGDIIQKRPAFSRTVFDASVNKMSVLDIKLAGQISKLYAAITRDQEYIHLDPHVTLDTAVKLIEKVMAEAESLIGPIDAALNGLRQNSHTS